MKAASNIRLILVDDHFVVRMGLAGSLALEPDMKVVAECSTGEEAVERYRHHHPDVMILDNRLPGMSGIEVSKTIRSEFSTARILMLSVREGEEDIYQAVQAGVTGYLPKSARRDEIVSAIRTIHAGGTWFSAAIAAKLQARRQRPELTPRELEVLHCIVRGRTNKEIAEDLKLAEVTIKLHVGNLLEKLDVQDRTQAATAAIQRGIIHLD